MRFSTSYAQAEHGDGIENARIAASRIERDLAGFSPALVIYFAATNYDPHVLATAMKAAFPGAVTLGCSTAGEAVDGKILKGSVVAMAFGAEVFDYCRFALVFDGKLPLFENAFASVDAAMSYLARDAGSLPIDLDYRRYVGIMLSDRITTFTEQLLDRLGELTDVLFVGGFAGEDMKFRDEQTLSYDGQVYRDATLLGLWKPRDGFSLIKTQAAELTDCVLTITRADEEKKIIWELDDMPAVRAYARAIGSTEEALAQINMDEWALALTFDGEPFIRPITHIVDGGGLGLFTTVREGMRLTLTRVGNVVESTARALAENRRKEGRPAAFLHFNCVSRHAFLESHGQSDDFAALFEGVPHIALASYGEIYIGVVALTSTMIAFK